MNDMIFHNTIALIYIAERLFSLILMQNLSQVETHFQCNFCRDCLCLYAANSCHLFGRSKSLAYIFQRGTQGKRLL